MFGQIKPHTEAASPDKGVKSPLQLSENRVWHQLVLSNTTRVPWTRAG